MSCTITIFFNNRYSDKFYLFDINIVDTLSNPVNGILYCFVTFNQEFLGRIVLMKGFSYNKKAVDCQLYDAAVFLVCLHCSIRSGENVNSKSEQTK